MKYQHLAAITIDRRTVALAVFEDLRITFAKTRYLSSDLHPAEKTVLDFINSYLERFSVDAVAVETTPGAAQIRSARLRAAVIAEIRKSGTPIWEVRIESLLSAFGHPPLRYRLNLRRVVSTIWPTLNERRLGGIAQDAAALGLYAQTERLLSLHEPEDC